MTEPRPGRTTTDEHGRTTIHGDNGRDLLVTPASHPEARLPKLGRPVRESDRHDWSTGYGDPFHARRVAQLWAAMPQECPGCGGAVDRTSRAAFALLGWHPACKFPGVARSIVASASGENIDELVLEFRCARRKFAEMAKAR